MKPFLDPDRQQETVPCETCGEPTTFLGTKRCNNCYEVESRLDQYLASIGGLEVVVEKLRVLGQALYPEMRKSDEKRV